jgi:hypothetical protein
MILSRSPHSSTGTARGLLRRRINDTLPLEGGGCGPAPRRMQDKVLNLTWFRGGGEWEDLVPLPFSPPTKGGEIFEDYFLKWEVRYV